MLNAIRDAISRPGPHRLDEVARRVGASPEALSPMLELLAHRGHLPPEVAAGCAGTCGTSCTPAAICPYLVRMPRTIEVARP